jgi:N-acetylglutamate synthase-like GNAT family acetyltransferase
MKEFRVEYYKDNNYDFVDRLLKASNEDTNMGIGYPRCEGIEELISEVELYDNKLSECICLIFDEDKPIGMGGFLYTEGESEGYFIGPILVEEYFVKENVNYIIKLILESKRYSFKKLLGVCTDKNQTLNESYTATGWKYKTTQREMKYDVDKSIKQVKWQVCELDKTEVKKSQDIFQILDKTFNWGGDRENFNELLRDEYKVGCVLDNEKNILGLVVWAYLEAVDFSRLEYLVVNESNRKNGIGEAMINHVINDANRQNVKNIYLSTGINNAAVRFYNKTGFYDTVVSNIYERKY